MYLVFVYLVFIIGICLFLFYHFVKFLKAGTAAFEKYIDKNQN